MIKCIVIDDDSFVRKLTEFFISRVKSLHLLHSLDNAEKAVDILQSREQIDLIFLDIEMNGMNGIDFLNLLEKPPQIIIISSKEKYAIKAFEYNVTDYLLKPFTYVRFLKAVDKVVKKLALQATGTYNPSEEIFIKHHSSMVRLKYNEIMWVEAMENYVVFNTFTERFTIHATMKSIEKKLPAETFVRTHRSFIVNLNCVSCIEDHSIVIKTKDGVNHISIGKMYKENLMKNITILP
ncbi:MAG: LytTR family DNA-binding domain-containing protein [Bacteroidales bacterium]|jgi:DNA-binding LytR/AlgR family response regulator|nr:LytTR family DNA-binding domain-containing protein [Bacteroidales bacterium]